MPCKKHFGFLATAILAALMVTLAVALPGVSADGDEDKNREIDQSEDQALPLPDKTELNHPNLGSHLNGLVVQVEDGETTSQDAALDTPVHSRASVAVTIHLTGNVDDVVTFLEENGGSSRNVGAGYIEAYVPVTLLGQLSEQPGVIRVREIVPAVEHQSTQRIAGQGPQEHGSPSWNQAGYSGQGVKVGVIDSFFGFNDFSSLMGTELPSTVQARCYTDVGRFTQNVADCANAVVGSAHGTLVAEAVMDIAPEASLYIASPWSRGDTNSAVDWMASQGVSVIVHAETFFFDGPGDGTSPFGDSPLRTVDRAVAGGIVWAHAAGNLAQQTWFGPYSTVESEDIRFLDFHGSDVFNEMLLDAGDWITVQLRWDDSWRGASRDFDLLLWDFAAADIVAYSFDLQGGGPGQVPSEELRYQVPRDGRYAVVVAHDSGSTPDWLQVTVGGVGSIQHYTGNGSIGNPGESANPGMLAVGAAHWNDVRAIEPYSSRGPTPDGRVKPDIVGADCGATALSPLNEYNSGFCGTSQAAPHIAGMAALVRQRFPDYTPAQVASYLKDNAEQRQSPDPNSTWGHGFAKLPPPDGTARPTTPAPSNAFTRNPAADFDGLQSAGNSGPQGIWSDGTTMWVADWIHGKIFAYDLTTKAWVPGRDFNTLLTALNVAPRDIWSDGETMWVADSFLEKIYAYDLATKAWVPSKDFDSLIAAGNTWPQGIWSDGTTMWAADFIEEKIYAYDLATKARVPGKDFDTLKASGNISPQGIWSDGTTMWVADSYYDKVYAYDTATKARVPAREFNTLNAAGNWIPRGIWSDGATMWVADWQDAKIYAYRMPQEPSPDREALIALYNATGGANWTNSTNWLTNAPIGQWHGVTTDRQGRVTNLDLNDNQLSGTIPTQLGNLANLEKLLLTRNQLTGTIPAELASLTGLDILALGGNQLSGEIPPELGSLSNLVELSLWENELTGTIPSELGSLSNLELLSLLSNQLSGEIPPELGSLSSLVELSLRGNELTGEIPAGLGSLANLEELWLSENQLSGEIPPELGSLSNLVELSLWGNELTGEIPAGLGSLSNLEELWLSENQLSGEIPPELGSLSNLVELSLWGNELTGEIPAGLGSLSSLELLSLSSNQLTGEIPAELGRLSNLEQLYISSNQLTGEIPAALGSLSNLEQLSLSRNQLTGQIPTELSRLSKLALLSLSSNQLSGEIPPELGNLTNLEGLYLWDNQLSGTVPQTLVGLTMLESFIFHYNPGLCAPIDDAFQTWLGSISTVLGSSCAPADSPEDRAVLVQVHSATDGANWTNNTNWLSEHLTREWYGVTNDANGRVHGLFLGSNQLTGRIPSELGSMTQLEWVYLNHNQLAGKIPSELGDLANLRLLSLRDNQLTGEIPPELGSLANLEWLRLNNNQLTGEIPAELGRLTNLKELHLSGNQLTGCVPASLQDVADKRLRPAWAGLLPIRGPADCPVRRQRRQGN